MSFLSRASQPSIYRVLHWSLAAVVFSLCEQKHYFCLQLLKKFQLLLFLWKLRSRLQLKKEEICFSFGSLTEKQIHRMRYTSLKMPIENVGRQLQQFFTVFVEYCCLRGNSSFTTRNYRKDTVIMFTEKFSKVYFLAKKDVRIFYSHFEMR